LGPLPEEITSPVAGGNVSGMLNITWDTFVDPDGETVIYNVSLFNSIGTFNQAINTSTNFTSQLFNTSSVTDGAWIIYVKGCGAEDNLCSNSSVNFTIDNTKPSVTLEYPAGESTIRSSTTSLNWTATDSIYASMICNVTLDSTVNSSIASPNGSIVNFTVNGLIDGLHYWNVTCSDSAGNSNISETRQFRINTSIEPVTQTAGGSSGSGMISQGIIPETNILRGIEANALTILTLSGKTGINELLFTSTENIPLATIRVMRQEEAEKEIPAPEGKLYSYIRIYAYELENKTKEAKLKFEVSKEWIAGNNVNPKRIIMQRYKNGWQKLATGLIGEDNASLYYESISPGFSLFAITALAPAESQISKEKNTTEKKAPAEVKEEEIIPEEAKATATRSYAWPAALAAAAIIASFLAGLKACKRCRQKQKKHGKQ
jgi:PGF-pre-PGF domain-containing protein